MCLLMPHTTMARGALYLPCWVASFSRVRVSGASTTINAQGCKLHAEGAAMAARNSTSIFSRATGLSSNARMLLRARMVSNTG